MSDASVSERRIRPIKDAATGGNWKQALQLCDKWSKKGEKSDRFLALRAFVLVNHPEKSQHTRGRTEVLDLCKRNPPITEPEAIYQMQDALKTLSLREVEGPKLWERAVTAKQNDQDLYVRWLNQAIADDNWFSAQKATMGLRKSFPKERKYEFWNIMMCHLIHMQKDLPEKDRMLFGTLAYRMISKAAETVPTEQEEILSPGKAISTPEEISLLAQVLNSTGRTEETVKLLQGVALNMDSRIGQQDPQLVLSLLLEALDSSQKWDEALPLCQRLLSKPVHQSDDRIWNLWLRALPESSVDRVEQESQDLLDSACGTRPIIRAAYMAKMKFLQRRGGKNDPVALSQTCSEYSEAFSQKAFCFDDLKDSVLHLDEASLRGFMKTHSNSQESLAQLFSLKLSYGSFPSAVSEEDILSFISQALELFQTSLSEAPSCPEAVILAVMAILKVSITEGRSQNVLFAAIILQIARSKFEDYYLFTVLLVQIQAHLGLLSLAMDAFSKLSVKNMQWETVGHVLLTRISSLHPAVNSHGEEGLEPLAAIGTGLTVLENADNALVRGIRQGLRFNSYSNIYNSVKMRSDIEHSVNRQVYAIEERKLQRLLGMSEETVLPPSPSALVDKRDFSYLPAYRLDDSEVLANLRCGPLPKENWINAMALLDNTATYLKAELTTQAALAAKALENLKEAQSRIDDRASEDVEAELTSTELANFECHKILAQTVVLMKDPSAPHDKTTSLLQSLKTWIIKALEERKNQPSDSPATDHLRTPTWQDLHTSLTQLETLQAVAMLLALQKRKSKPAKSPAQEAQLLSDLQTFTTDLERQIHDDARVLKAQVGAPGVLGRLVDMGMAREGHFAALAGVLEKMVDEVTLETICGRIKESWEDALDGVLAVGVKLYK